MNDESHDLPADLLDVAQALTEHRPRMSGPELGRVRERAIGTGSRTATPPGGFMRSRIAITALLTTGALMCSGGAAIGVTALSTTFDASQAQYGPVETTPSDNAPSGDTLGTDSSGSDTADTPAGSATKGTSDEQTATAQPARQLEAADGDDLPFTGYAAIPLLLLGLALLVAGLLLRRGTNTSQVT